MDVTLSQGTTDNYRLGLERQVQAHDVYLRHVMQEKLARIDRLRNRKYQTYDAGDRVCVWRVGKGSDIQGRWFGPGEVLGTRRFVVDGEFHIGNQLYVIMHGKIWCCSPALIRPASEREALRKQEKMCGLDVEKETYQQLTLEKLSTFSRKIPPPTTEEFCGLDHDDATATLTIWFGQQERRRRHDHNGDDATTTLAIWPRQPGRRQAGPETGRSIGTKGASPVCRRREGMPELTRRRDRCDADSFTSKTRRRTL